MQANHLKSETETYEEKEQQLVNDCVKELSKSHSPFLSRVFLCLCACFKFWTHVFPSLRLN